MLYKKLDITKTPGKRLQKQQGRGLPPMFDKAAEHAHRQVVARRQFIRGFLRKRNGSAFR